MTTPSQPQSQPPGVIEEAELVEAVATPRRWWEQGVIYQVYPRSFQDSNGDGIGDLPGLIRRLDYLRWLGVDAIWLSPIYPSPMADFGYDVADYTDIDPIFGTLEDFDRLVEEAHRRGLRVIVDFVPNHTSDEHPWFRESRSSRDNPKRDWYVWRDPAQRGQPPNNWLSVFGGEAWAWDEQTQQYYLHVFHVKQPDLNWRNPEVQREMLGVLRFWLDRGVDGFRVDVMNHLSKDEQLRNNPPNPDFDPDSDTTYESLVPAYSTNQPEVHDFVSMMRSVVDEYDDRVLIGEVYVPINVLVTYYGTEGRGAHLPFNFQLLLLPWDAQEVEAVVDEYEAALPDDAWPNWVIGNHDQPRVASRVGLAQARIGAMLLLTLRGTPTMYYGDEVGMTNVLIPAKEILDPQGLHKSFAGRDPYRSPMQWDSSPHAGFSTTAPWLPVHADFREQNVESERRDERSMLALYRRLLSLRRRERALSVGRFIPLSGPHEPGLVVYVREDEDGRRLLVALNLTAEPHRASLEELSGRVMLSTHLDREGEPVVGTLELRADEGVVLELEPA